MYEAFFHLNSRPFPSTPRVDRYFPAGAIEDAYRTLSRCVDRAEGPGIIIGGAGTGKSLLCEMLATRFRERFHVVRLDSARLCTRRALLQNILFELHLPYRGMDEGELRLSLIDFLEPGEASRDGMLLNVDEAHTLPMRLIEEIRMITNLVRDGQPRARLVLAGGPALEERLANPKLESLNQRIAARCYLQPLNYDETLDYARSQIAAVGGEPDRLFVGDALQAVYHATGGIPRLINQVCDHAMILASVARRQQLDAGVIEEAWADLQQLPMPPASRTQSPEATDAVVEFGSLDDPATHDAPLLDNELVMDDNPTTADESMAGYQAPLADEAVFADEAVSTDDTDVIEDDFERDEIDTIEFDLSVKKDREIDLAGQLEEIKQRFAEIESFDAALSCESAFVAQDPSPTPGDAPESVREPGEEMVDPFAGRFECEETVVDHYSILEARAQSRAASAPRLQDGDLTSAIERIFGPIEQTQSQAVETGPASPGLAEPRDDSTVSDRWEEAERMLDWALENEQLPKTETLFAAGLDTESAESNESIIEAEVVDEQPDDEQPDDEQLDGEPDVVRASVMRALPPDDSDLIILVDDQMGSEPLDKLPARTHRREYRDLFTRLREN